MSDLSELPKSRREALAAGAARFFTGNPCKHGHLAYRYACGGACSACSDAVTLARYYRVKGTPEYKEARRAKAQRQRQQNPEQVAVWLADWKIRNAERRRQYRIDRRSLYAAHAAKRRAAELERTPVWADERQTQSMYEVAARMSRSFGIEMQVDHVVPLQGERVSGLHVHYNLQIIPALVNQKKSNRFEVTA